MKPRLLEIVHRREGMSSYCDDCKNNTNHDPLYIIEYENVSGYVLDLCEKHYLKRLDLDDFTKQFLKVLGND